MHAPKEETDPRSQPVTPPVEIPPESDDPTPEEIAQMEADFAQQNSADERKAILDVHRVRLGYSKVRTFRREANAHLLAGLVAMLRPPGNVEAYATVELPEAVQRMAERATIAVLREIEMDALDEIEGDEGGGGEHDFSGPGPGPEGEV